MSPAGTIDCAIFKTPPYWGVTEGAAVVVVGGLVVVVDATGAVEAGA